MSGTYANLAVRAPIEEAVGVLDVAGVPGVVGPQAGEWCGVFVDADAYGLVGADRRNINTVALRLSDRTDSTVLLVSVFENAVLGYDLFHRGRAVGYYVSRPGHWTGEDLPAEGGAVDVLTEMCGVPDVDGHLGAALARDAFGDEVSRHRRLCELLGLPRYLVGAGRADVGAATDGYVALEPMPARRAPDTSRALRIVTLGLACFALFVWVQAFREGSWGTGVFAVVASGIAVLAGWLSFDLPKVRGRQ
ncbi:MAG: hypothetical protein J2P14_15770 [Acidothermales bacterium]|nr:hypothetical protein [Acidothermales bacterium]